MMKVKFVDPTEIVGLLLDLLMAMLISILINLISS
jgi:hypothetical protein